MVNLQIQRSLIGNMAASGWEVMEASKKCVQSRIELLIQVSEARVLLYLPSSVGDSIGSFYVSESSKNLSNRTFG